MNNKAEQLTEKQIPKQWLDFYPNQVPIIHTLRDVLPNHLRLHWLSK